MIQLTPKWKRHSLLVVSFSLTALFGWLYLRETILMDSRLPGYWQYSVPYPAYPRYSSSLEFNADGTYIKTEEFTARPDTSPAISVFKGNYQTSGCGLESGMIALSIHNASATIDGATVCKSPDGGYLAICRFGFDKSGKLMISELVGGLPGHKKDPEKLPSESLIPSWEFYSRKTGSASEGAG